MSFTIEFSSEAEETYTAVIEQLRDRWGDRFVSKLEIKLDKCFVNLIHAPYMYPVFDERIELRRCVLHNNCSMLYKVNGNIVSIAYFWDNRQEQLNR